MFYKLKITIAIALMASMAISFSPQYGNSFSYAETSDNQPAVESTSNESSVSDAGCTSETFYSNGLTREQIENLIENKISPYELQCPLTPEQTYAIQQEMLVYMGQQRYESFVKILDSSRQELQKTLVGGRYKELIDPDNWRWAAYEENNYFDVANVLRDWTNQTGNARVKEDLDLFVNLIDYGTENHDILSIIDANRILQDIYRHVLRTSYGTENDYSHFHKLYFGVTMTIEGKHKMISNPVSLNEYIEKKRSASYSGDGVSDIDFESLDMENLTREQTIALVEKKINPYERKCPVTPEDTYKIKEGMILHMGIERYDRFVDVMNSSRYELQKTLVGYRYRDLIDKDHPRWTAYEQNNYYDVANVLRDWVGETGNANVEEDLRLYVSLIDYGTKNHDVLSIIDANRIIQDLYRHVIRTPYNSEGDYSDLYDLYFGVTKTLEGKHDIISK